jgi:hypothetical protein
MSESEEFTDDLDTPTEGDLNECYGSKYLSAADIDNRKIRTRIAKVRKEPMQQQDGKPERAKFVLYFTTISKPMVLNATNKNAVVDALGTKPANWKNAEVGLYTEPTQYAGKPTRGLRLRVLSARKSEPILAPKPAPTPQPTAAVAAVAEEVWDSADPGHTGEGVDFPEAAE